MRPRIKTMMSGLFALLLAGTTFGADVTFQDLMSAAKEAAGKGDFDNALTNYNAAFQSADKPELKVDVLLARNQFLLQNKKSGDAEKLLKEFLQDESLPPLVRRKVLLTLSGQIMWRQADEAKQYLDQAITIPTTDVNEQARTSITMGYIYSIKKQPENALEALLPIMEIREVALGLHSTIACQIGVIYQQLNDLEKARKYFQLAVDYGRKVQYKYDYSGAEKALKALNERK